MSRGPADLPAFLPAEDSFLDPVRADAASPADARAVVIPFGLEASVSYGSGTAAGPKAIIAASQQLELYDEELGREAYLDYGVAALSRSRPSPSRCRRRWISLPAWSAACSTRASFPSCWAASIR